MRGKVIVSLVAAILLWTYILVPLPTTWDEQVMFRDENPLSNMSANEDSDLCIRDTILEAVAGPPQSSKEGDAIVLNASVSLEEMPFIVPPNERVTDTKEGSFHALGLAVDSNSTAYVTWPRADDPGKLHELSIDKRPMNGSFGMDIHVGFNSSGHNIGIATGPQEKVYLLWVDKGIRFAISFDGGVTFESPVWVNDTRASMYGWVSLHVDENGTIYTAWFDTRSKTHWDHYFSKSVDGGTTFTPNVKVNDQPLPADEPTYMPTVYGRSDGVIFLIWEDQRTKEGNPDVYFSKSFDGGLSFSTDYRLSDLADGMGFHPTMSVDGNGTIHVAWAGAYRKLVYTRSFDNGSTFETPRTMTACGWGLSVWISSAPSRYVGLTWSASNSTLGDRGDIFLRISDDGGDSFGPAVKINDDKSSTWQTSPQVFTDDFSGINIAWLDRRHDTGSYHLDPYFASIPLNNLTAPLLFSYVWDLDANRDADGDGNFTNDPDATGQTVSVIYGDNGVYTITLNVTDELGNRDSDTTIVTVLNVDPVIIDWNYTLVSVQSPARTIGYWNHQCGVEEPYGNHTGILERWVSRIANRSILFSHISAKEEVCSILSIMDHSDMTQKAMQQLMALWLNLISGKLQNDSFVNLPELTENNTLVNIIEEIEHIVLNIHDKEEMERAKDIADSINNRHGSVSLQISTYAISMDPGSDDLTFIWDWGDGSNTTHMYYNNGISPDPPMSPEVNPIDVKDTTQHSYATAGIYTIILIVMDDDGGMAQGSVVIEI